MNEKVFPKFQYSVFLDDKRDEQIVIRTDTWEEFLDAKVEVNKILEKRQKQNAFTTPAVMSPNASGQEKQPDLGSCPKCGAPMIHNPKTGKNFCKAKCWLK